jgi:hypothetical protein
MANYGKEAFTSPKGNLKWAFITGEGRKKKYSVVVSVPEEEAKEAMAYIDQWWKDNRPKQSKPRPKSTGYKYEENEDTGERTGNVYFSFSTVTEFPSGDPKVVKIFTAKAPVREVQLGKKQIGDGSIGRAIGTLAIFEYEGSFGTTLYLDAISLSKFVEYVGGVDASNVEADDDAEDIDLGTAEVGTDAVQDEEETEKPRV